MIDDFVASWPLFHTSYLTGWAIAFVLALVGVWIVARDQIFLGVAVAQASTLGVALALWLGAMGFGAFGAARFGEDVVAAALAVATSVATALFTVLRRSDGRESAEAVTGWVFLVAASVPTLLLADDPHGLEEVHQLLFSTLLGATSFDLAVFGVLAVSTAALAARHQEVLRLLAIDPAQIDVVGIRSRAWHAGLAIWMGIAVGLSIRVSGTLYTFGCLVLPALVAKHLVRDVRTLLWVAPVIAVVAAVAGFVLANHLDVPPAHATVALLCSGLAAAWLRARVHP